MKPIGLQLYSVREYAKDDFLGTLRKVAEMGYAGVEGGTGGMAPAEYKKVLDDLGLRATSMYHALADEDNIQEIVDAAGVLGVNVIICGCAREAWDTPEGIRQAAAGLQPSAELLKRHGLLQAYHNHWWEVQNFDGTLGLEILYEHAPDVHSELDVYWAAHFGDVDVPAFLRKWSARCPLLHVKDGPLVQGEPHTAVGAGKMDIPAVVAAADENVLQWLTVEIDRCETDMMAAVRESLEYLLANGLGVGRA